MNKLQERKNNNKGFSLVELIIVIAIMAVLVAILAPAFMRYVEESRQKADISATDSIIQSVKAAYTNSEFSVSGTETVTIKISKSDKLKATHSNGAEQTNLDNALKASDVDSASFKSAKWGTVTLTFKESNGVLGVEISESGESDNVKMSEKYNDGKNKAGAAPAASATPTP